MPASFRGCAIFLMRHISTPAPYVADAVADRRIDAPGAGFERQHVPNGGVDLKWAPDRATTFDATLRPDFSQVEADAAQVTVDKRFAIDLPEQRPFFLDGSGLLA